MKETKYTRQESHTADLARENAGEAGDASKSPPDSPQNSGERRLIEAFRRLSDDQKTAMVEQAERSVTTPEAGT